MRETIQLFRPAIGDEEIRAVEEVMRSGWLGLGPKTAEFERAFASAIGAFRVVGTISGTAALDLAVRLLNLSPGDEILAPTITFVSTAHVIVYNNCRPVFVDVDPVTLNISVEDVKRKLSSRTRAIMVVHYGGRPAELDELRAAVGHVPIIEDCAHASGAYYKGKHVGTFGEMGCFSFHAVKNLTMGEGGALAVHEKAHADRALQLRWLGIDKGTWERTPDNKSYWWEYAVNEVGLKCHLNDILAAIGIVQLKKLAALNARRKQIVDRYREAFADLDWLEMPAPDDADHRSSWHICCVRLRGRDRDALSEYLKAHAIMTGVHYKPIHLYRCYGYQLFLEVAEREFRRMISLPNHPGLSDDDVAHIIETIRRFPG